MHCKQVCLALHSDLAECLAQGRRVVIHSRKSWGRAPTAVATFILRAHPEVTPDVAIEHVRACCGRHAVQTVKQYNHVHEYDEHRKAVAAAQTAAAVRPHADAKVGKSPP